MKYIKQLTLLIGIVLICQKGILAKTNKVSKKETSELSKQIKGFEADYLTNKTFKNKGKQRQKFFGILTFLINLFFDEDKGKYNSDTKNGEGPYFIFDRNPEGPSLKEQLEALRQKIINNEDGYGKIYEQIFINARDNTPTNCNKADVCEGAAIAKNCAFVFVVGLKYVESTDEFKEFKMDSLPDVEARRVYQTKAFNYLRNLSGNELDNDFDAALDVGRFVGGPIGEAGAGMIWMGLEAMNEGLHKGYVSSREQMKHRSKELMMIVQTFDMLEWAHIIDTDLSTSQQAQLYKDIRKRIKEKYVVPMHRRCQIPLTGVYDAHNNYTLMPAASLGAAAIVLRNEGDKLTHTHKQPDRWANSALYNIENTMWHWGVFNDAESKRGQDFGFTEGPHYFRFSFETMLPYFKARYNLRPEAFTHSYSSGTLSVFSRNVSNQFFDKDYDRLYEWSNKISLPNGTLPAYDDTWAYTYFNGPLAIRGRANGFKQQNWVNNTQTLGLVGTTGMNLMADYLATVTNPLKEYEPLVFIGSNEIVARGIALDSNKKETPYYLHLNTKTLDAVSYYHEHADVSSFILGIGTDILAIDPGYNGEDKDRENNDYREGNLHNVITIDGKGPDQDDEYEYKHALDKIFYKEYFVKTNYWNYNLNIRTSKKAVISRKITINDDTYPLMIQITDEVDNRNWGNDQQVEFNLNGNGKLTGNPNTDSYKTIGGNGGEWFHPCIKDNYNADNWKMQAFTTSFIKDQVQNFAANNITLGLHSTTAQTQDKDYFDANKMNLSTLKSGFGNITNNIGAVGVHTRFSKEMILPVQGTGIFKTTIMLRQCTDTATDIPIGRDLGKYTSHLNPLTYPESGEHVLHFSL